MGRARDLGYLKHDGNVVMIIIEFLKYILFIFMIFTPFVAPAVFCFFVGWMIPREQITQKRIILVLAVNICLYWNRKPENKITLHSTKMPRMPYDGIWMPVFHRKVK